MRAGISVSVIFLVLSITVVSGSSNATFKASLHPNSWSFLADTNNNNVNLMSSEAPNTTAIPTTVVPTTVVPTTVVPTTVPTTTVPTTPPVTLNPNIKISNYAMVYKKAFISNMNSQRNTFLPGRFAYKLKWDESLEASAAKRAENCSLIPENGKDYQEVILTEKIWKYTINLPDRMQTKLVQVIYMKGLSRVGCVNVISCDKKGYAFCHFGVSLLSADPGFENRAPECTFDEKLSNLCLDLAPSTPEPTTELYRVPNPMRRHSRPLFGFSSFLLVFAMIY